MSLVDSQYIDDLLRHILVASTDEEEPDKAELYYNFTDSLEQGVLSYTYLYNLPQTNMLRKLSSYYSIRGLEHGYKDDKVTKVFYSALAAPSKKVVEGKEVEVTYKLPSVSFPYILGNNHSGQKDIESSNESILKTLKSLFPSFKLSSKIWGDDNTHYSNKISHPEYKAIVSIEDLRRVSRDALDQLKIDTDYLPYKGFLGFALTIPANSITINSVTNESFNADDEITKHTSKLGSYATFTLDIQLEVALVLKFPKNYAYWVVGANRKNRKFVPAFFLQFVNTHVNYFSSDIEPAGGWPTRNLPLDLIAEQSKADAKKYPILAAPRINKERFSILHSGEIFFVPDADNSKSFVAALEHISEDKTFRQVINEAQLADSPLLSDWVNGFAAFCDDKGDIIYKELNGSRPLDNVTIARALHGDVNQESFTSTIRVLRDKVLQVLPENNSTNLPAIPGQQTKSMYRRLNDIFMWASQATDVAIWEILDSRHYNEQDQFAMIREDLPYFRAYCKHVFNNIHKVPFGVTVRYSNFAFLMALVGVYSETVGKFKEDYHAGIDDNKIVAVDTSKIEDIVVPGLSGLNSYLPHQARTIYNLHMRNEPPKFTILEIDPGGGKTLLGLSDICMLLYNKKIKRPVVVAPGGLVSEWCTEITKFSQGKLNAVPLRISTLDRLMNNLNWTEEQVINYYRSLPINSVIVTDLKFLAGTSSRNKAVAIGTKSVVRFSNTELLQRIEPDYCLLDESQRIKNLYAAQSRATRQLTATVKYVRLLSGTFINNTPVDLVGQMAAINPTILGNVKQFEENFLQDEHGGGLVAGISANLGNKLRKTYAPYTMRVQVKKREYAFLLPNIKEIMHTVTMSETQQNFYRAVIDEALREIMKDKILVQKMASGSEEDEAYIIRKLEPHLATAEQFVNAPDSNPAFRKLVGNNLAELTGAKIDLINDIIKEHFAVDQNKILIFGINKSVSKHIMDKFAYANQAVHYTAGDNTAIMRFRNDPKVKILVADQTSLAEGYNLQMASRMIRIQSAWTPGGQEQALARFYRPDVGQVYARDEVNLDIIITDNSLEVLKLARVISKMIAKASVDESENPAWKEIAGKFESVPPLKLSLDNLRTFAHKSSLAPYYEAYGTYRSWEDKQNMYGKAEQLRQTEAKIGRPVKDTLDFIQSSMIKVSHVDIPNSKSVFTPFVEGMQPHNPYGGKLKAVALVEHETDSLDDDDETIVENHAVKSGDLIYCEMGVGVVKSVGKNVVKVIVGGKDYTFAKTMVFVFEDDVVANKLKTQMKVNPKSVLRNPNTKDDTKLELETPKKPAPKITDKTEKPKVKKDDDIIDEVIKEDEEPEVEDYQDVRLEIYPSTVMGSAVLFSWAEKDTIPYLRQKRFRELPTAIFCKVKNYVGVENFLEFCKKKGIKVSSDRAAMLRTMAERMRGKGGKLETSNRVTVSDVRNFLLEQHKPINMNKNPTLIKPYPVVWDGELFIMVTKRANPKMARKLRGKLPGLSTFEEQDPMYVKFVGSKQDMLRELQTIKEEVHFSNYKSAVKEAKDMRYLAKKVDK